MIFPFGHRRSSRRTVVLFFGLAAIVLLGCGNRRETTTVSGTVTYQGTPVSVGAIYFHAADDQMAMGIIHEDGQFTATDVPVGEVRVSFQVKDPGLYDQQMKDGEMPSPPNARPRPKGVTRIPPRYADPDRSGLKYTIAPAMGPLDVKIE